MSELERKRPHAAWSALRSRAVSRRSMLRGASVAGAGLAGAALIGCGSSSTSTPTATAPAASTAAGSATAAPTAAATPAGPKTGGTYKYVITNDPPTIDPYGNLSFLTKGSAAYSYSRLYKVAARAGANPWAVGVEPDIAESAESTDGQHWTVKLKKGVKFHNIAPVNGREMTSADVLFSYNRLSGPESPGASLVKSAGWSKVEAVDDYTLNFTLDFPSADFLDDLADTNKLFVMPKEADGGFDPKQQMIGTGPWVMTNYSPSQSFSFDKNPDWVVQGLPYTDHCDVAIIPEYANRLAQFQAGNLHEAGINANDVLQLRSQQGDVQWLGTQSALLSHCYFSSAEQDPNAIWRDERFRQAISMCQDRDALLDLSYNVKKLQAAGLSPATSWNNVIPAGFARWWLDPQSAEQGDSAKYFKYTPDEAKKLLAAAGADGATFDYHYSPTVYGTTFTNIAEAIGNYMQAIGLKPTTVTEDYASKYITHTFRGDFHGVAFGYETPFPEVSGYFPRLFGDDPANHGRVSDPQITDLSKKQQAELDETKRKGYIYQIQQINDEHMYYVPSQAGAGTAWTAYRPEVRGVLQTRGYGIATEALPFRWIDA
jgi:peptide/nickel transport system substrate-binding protein